MISVRGSIIIGICDDTDMCIEHLQSCCEKVMFEKEDDYEYIVFHSVEEMNRYTGEKIDILFLDIEMPGKSGIEAKEDLITNENIGKIVYVSSYRDYVFDAFSTKTLGYEIKPISIESVEKYIHKILKLKKDNLYLSFDDKDVEKGVYLENLLYVQGQSNYIRVVTMDTEFVCVGTLKIVEEKYNLPNLVRVHKSYIVNIDNAKLKGNEIHLSNKEVIQCSRRLLKAVKESYSSYRMERMSEYVI